MQTLDQISIELKVSAFISEPDDIWMQGELEIFINEKKPYQESDIVDSYMFQESLTKDGEYFIFSCNCGVPECSGWIEGIKVYHEENIIIWTDSNKWDDSSNKRIWHFDKNKIEEDLKRQIMKH